MPGSRVERMLKTIEPDGVIQSLVSTTDLPELRAYLVGQDPLLSERAAALIVLVQDQSAVPLVEDALNSPFEQTRIAAAAGLWRMPELPVGAFRQALRDHAPGVRRFALRSVARRLDGDPGAASTLATVLDETAALETRPPQRAVAALLRARASGEPVSTAGVQRALELGASPTDVGTALPGDASSVIRDILSSTPAMAARAVEVALVM